MYINSEIELLEANPEIIKNINAQPLLDEIKNRFADFDTDENNYTDNYKTVIVSAFNNLNLSEHISTNFGGKHYGDTDEETIKKVLLQYVESLKTYDLLKFLKYKNRNNVFVGTNGCGKTTLIKKLNKLANSNDIRYFQADRMLIYDKDFTTYSDYEHFSNSYLSNLNGIANGGSYSSSMEFNYAIELFKRIRSKELESKKSNNSFVCKTDLIIDTWNKLIGSRVLSLGEDLKASMLNGNTYSISEISSGEKIILYFLICVLLEDDKKYYFIDEPEDFLNNSIVTRLWDIIESQKKDSVFIYLTHSKDFASTRLNADTYWIKSFDGNDWDYVLLPKDEAFPNELVIQLVGNKKPVVFVESEDRTKLDYRLYSTLFNNLTIIPSGGCDSVINKTKAYVNLQLPEQAYGIIDCDYKSDEFLTGDESKGVFHAPFFEVENFLICERIIKPLINSYSTDKDNAFDNVFNTIKNEFINNKDKFIIRNVLFNLNKIYYHDKINSIDTIEELKTILSEYKNNIDIEQLISDQETKYNNIVVNNDYDMYLRYLDRKKIFSLIQADIKFKNNLLYEDIVFDYLHNNADIANSISERYFITLFEINRNWSI